MIRLTLRFLCPMLILAFSGLAAAQDFSADVVGSKGNNDIKKIYATKDKVRLDGGEGARAQGPNAVIIDESQRKWIILMEARHMYVDSMPGMNKMPLITQLWHVQDVDDACPQWKKVADQAGTTQNWGSCTKIGSDTVGGRSTVKYEGVSKQGEKHHFWVDSKLHCVIKTDGSNGIELQNIKEGAQPASLFEIPAGYTKFDMSMMQQMQ
ncbi:MAG TPA: hypothetical protein VKV39_20320 [Candidatus Sulfotelmatobacter sp.]|nr:hypothetical protein [Candidatus Sulfotelmatobacter sp.]